MILCSCTYHREKPETIKIVFVGDLLLDRGVRERIEHGGIDALFHPSIDSVFGESDIVIANLECPATKIEKPVNKKYIFRSEPEWIQALKNHGITHLNLANNHSMDQGREGLTDTKENVLKAGMVPLGFGKNTNQACRTQLIASEPRKVFILSSLQVPSENWTYLEDKPCVCEEDFSTLSERIRKLKGSEPGSLIIVQLHWGAEHTIIPLASQKQQACQLIDAGADCLIGHHTHTIQPVEYYKGKPIYFSIGNFIFDQSKPINARGLMVRLVVSESTVKFDTVPFVIDECTPRLCPHHSHIPAV